MILAEASVQRRADDPAGIADNGTKAELTYSMSLKDKCLLLHLTIAGQPETEAIEGYDPGKKCWRHVAWYADGGHGELTIKLDAATLKGGPVGKRIEGTWVKWSADGKKDVITVTSTYLSESKWEWKDNAQKVIIERVKKNGK